jgi:hypothetical protein
VIGWTTESDKRRPSALDVLARFQAQDRSKGCSVRRDHGAARIPLRVKGVLRKPGACYSLEEEFFPEAPLI